MDIASQEDKRGIYLNNVGITNLMIPIAVRDRSIHRNMQYTIGTFNAFVDLLPEVRGTHMSRIVQMLYKHRNSISQEGIRDLLKDLIIELFATTSRVEIDFPYFTEDYSPMSELENLTTHQAHFEGKCWVTTFKEETDFHYVFRLGAKVDIMSVCPCALEECGNGNSHVQRGCINISVEPKDGAWIWLEDLIEIAQVSGSAPIFDRLKRPDEKYVVQQGFKNAKFVEDICRDVVTALKRRDDIAAYKVTVENFESIHSHNAYAEVSEKW